MDQFRQGVQPPALSFRPKSYTAACMSQMPDWDRQQEVGMQMDMQSYHLEVFRKAWGAVRMAIHVAPGLLVVNQSLTENGD